jgi:hypothetical protein
MGFAAEVSAFVAVVANPPLCLEHDVVRHSSQFGRRGRPSHSNRSHTSRSGRSGRSSGGSSGRSGVGA